MNWSDFNTNKNVFEEDSVNWSNRFKYVTNNIDDFGYILSKSKVKKVGQVYVGICPFPTHNEKTGSFTIYPRGYVNKGKEQEKTTFYCFGCGEGGDVIKFKQLYDGLENKREACKALEKEFELNINDENIRQELLKETLLSVKNSDNQYLTFSNINLICSKMCRNHLEWVGSNFNKDILDNEFEIIQKYYKYLDEEIGEMTMVDAISLIETTENIITERINILR